MPVVPLPEPFVVLPVVALPAPIVPVPEPVVFPADVPEASPVAGVPAFEVEVVSALWVVDLVLEQASKVKAAITSSARFAKFFIMLLD